MAELAYFFAIIAAEHRSQVPDTKAHLRPEHCR